LLNAIISLTTQISLQNRDALWGVKMKFKSFTFSLVLALGLATSMSGVAQAQIESGCDYLRNNNEDNYYHSTIGTLKFNAGETIVISSGEPSDDSPHVATQLTLDGILVDTDGFPGTVHYQFLADRTVQIQWYIEGTNVFNGGNVTWTTKCIQIGQYKGSSESIPTLSWQGITVLITLLTGFTYYRRRKDKV
jgi:hypothetical protein